MCVEGVGTVSVCAHIGSEEKVRLVEVVPVRVCKCVSVRCV